MNVIQLFVLSSVEGLTEFLPVSSTFHLILAAGLLGVEQSEYIKLFEVFIQAGAILAVFLMFLRHMIRRPKLLIRLAFAFVPTAVVGLVLYKVIKTVFFGSGMLMVSAFVIVGFLFIILEKYVFPKRGLTRNLDELTNKEAVLIGIVQSLAIIPGVSRAGAVMLGLMGMRYERKEAALFSFYLAVPTILAAAAYDLYKMRDLLTAGINFQLLLAGFIGAFVTALFGVRWFVKYLQGNTLASFGWYRIVLGIILLFIA